MVGILEIETNKSYRNLAKEWWKVEGKLEVMMIILFGPLLIYYVVWGTVRDEAFCCWGVAAYSIFKLIVFKRIRMFQALSIFILLYAGWVKFFQSL